jgi:predicted nucleic acid-binding protein
VTPPGRRRSELAAWLLGLEQRFAVQIPAGDGLIAATAVRHGLRVMTHNSRHVVASGAPIIDPWADGG